MTRKGAVVLAGLSLFGCGAEREAAPTEVVAVVKASASTFYIGHSSPCHLVYPNGAMLRWATTIATARVSGQLDSLTTTIRDETVGQEARKTTLDRDRIADAAGTTRVTAGEPLTVEQLALFGTCVPEDFTRHRFTIRVEAALTDDRGVRHQVAAGPVGVGPTTP